MMPLNGSIDAAVQTARGWIETGDPLGIGALWVLVILVHVGLSSGFRRYELWDRRGHGHQVTLPQARLLPQLGRFTPGALLYRQLDLPNCPLSSRGIELFGWRTVIGSLIIEAGVGLLNHVVIFGAISVAVDRGLMAPILATALGSLVWASGSSKVAALTRLLVSGPLLGSLWLVGHGTVAVATHAALAGGALGLGLSSIALARYRRKQSHPVRTTTG